MVLKINLSEKYSMELDTQTQGASDQKAIKLWYESLKCAHYITKYNHTMKVRPFLNSRYLQVVTGDYITVSVATQLYIDSVKTCRSRAGH